MVALCSFYIRELSVAYANNQTSISPTHFDSVVVVAIVNFS